MMALIASAGRHAHIPINALGLALFLFLLTFTKISIYVVWRDIKWKSGHSRRNFTKIKPFQRKGGDMPRPKYKRRAGLVMVTSKKTLHSYLVKTMNIHFCVVNLRWRLNHGLMFPDLQKEYDEYGPKWFSVGVLEDMKGDLDTFSKEEYTSWLNERFEWYIADIKPYFNVRYRDIPPMTTIMRDDIDKLGEIMKNERFTPRLLTEVKGLYVITHRKSGRQHIGYSLKIGNRINDLRNGVRKLLNGEEHRRGGVAKDLVEDWKVSGEEGFTVEFMETPDWTEHEMKAGFKYLLGKLQPYYTMQARARGLKNYELGKYATRDVFKKYKNVAP